MNKLPEKIQELNESIKILSQENSFSNTQNVINNLVSLFGIESKNEWKLFTDSQGKIRSNAGWFMEAEGFADRRASYKISNDNLEKIDLKLYWVRKPKKSIISWLVALTPNFEDEPFYGNLNVGIDFVIPEKTDKVIVVLSKNYVIRTLELSGELTITQQEIFSKWLQEFDFTNKAQVHEILWQSFDIEPLNKRFYKEVSSFFVELKQHLIKEKVFDDKHASYFVNRLIGRLVFCWFLDKKGIINTEIDYFNTKGKNATEYYREKLETLFFKVFNTPVEDREKGIDSTTPFLNGGLFEEKLGDKHGDPKLTFPADYFDRLIDFLHHYNFTTDESTSTFQQVAIDPEMLGRIFENLLAEQTEETGEQARKAKGAFYTPREIVDYMSRESLRQYLKNKLGDEGKSFELIDNLLDSKEHDWRDQQRNYRDKLKPYKYDILKALDELKILDPACGSGAFPMGMLSLLLQTYERLDATFDSYKKKLEIIKNNLHGVDIEPMAVEISRLRAWLSIVVDEDVDSNKIKPLPNLDFKFVCANSLISLDANKQTQMLDQADKLEEEMQEIREKYFNARSPKVKELLKIKFNKLLEEKNQGNLFGKSKKLEQLQSYHPFDNEQVTEFFDPEFMFGINGFDVVIGNPPYIDSESMKKNGQLELRDTIQQNYNWTKGNWDIYIAFLELGFHNITKEGVLVYITPDKWISKSFGDELRRGIISNIYSILKSGRNVFETAKVDSIITFISKTEHDSIKVVEYTKDGFQYKRNYPKDKLMDPYALDFIFSENLVFLEKIEKFIKKLSDYAICENACATSDAYKLKPLLENINKDNFDPSKYFKIINTGTISKYSSRWGKKEMTYLKDKYLCPVVNKEIFIKEFPNSYGQKASKYKIIIKGLNLLDGTLDSCGDTIPAKTTLIVTSDKIDNLKFLLALLNNKLILFFLKEKYPASSYNQGISFTKDMINNYPIPDVDDTQKNEIVNLVNQILEIKKENSEADTSELEEKIDQLVYELYDLTDEEIKVIEESS